eukprot:TRINITY_DN2261_c0_g1_i1.p1 TRINITY_DN2261_c0_g1~~TRINITY_DN2261_c0_g1_i1.p1  ORF type:complete len:435 (+),score=51.83 TRINITY_DN2261_c0_g1_i1:66-1307(+)
MHHKTPEDDRGEGSTPGETLSPDKMKERWVRIIKDLNESRNAIRKATQVAFHYRLVANDLVAYMLRVMRAASEDVKKRKAIFFLLDSICQQGKLTGESCPYHALVQAHMEEIVQLASAPDSSGADNRGSVQRVFKYWMQREVFPEYTIQLGLAILQGTNSHTTSSGGRPKRKAVAVSSEVEEYLREMENTRHEQKRLKWESRLRPENDPPGAEFDEMWTRAQPDWNLLCSFEGWEQYYVQLDCSRSQSPVTSTATSPETDSVISRSPHTPSTPSTPYSPSVIPPFPTPTPTAVHLLSQAKLPTAFPVPSPLPYSTIPLHLHAAKQAAANSWLSLYHPLLKQQQAQMTSHRPFATLPTTLLLNSAQWGASPLSVAPMAFMLQQQAAQQQAQQPVTNPFLYHHTSHTSGARSSSP